MSEFHQQFTIHPIGQGLFYSGFLKLRDSRFDFVFDCGSKNPSDLSREIARYRSERQIDQHGLDLLVISHFDNDHVSGIDELLKGVKVRRLVLPFLNYRERLFLVARTLLAGRGYKPALDFTLRLTIDPLSTLGDNLDGDAQVFFVGDDPEPILEPGIQDQKSGRRDHQKSGGETGSVL
ncbi:MBL fold metallo-hydrolase [Mucilaginibacter psychrotolerans]|uniref:MBL fold metallo-hydrolase n=1 Tax=Mucilaginibacter psychrotolerans TaxID=1524096 RepID=UPI0013053C64|nr:MBL fold metallo-hydrolase [Mucilaginibacter psychrotolerans]